MIELEIPTELTELRGGTKWRYATQQFPQWASAWVCFRPDVEEWITKSFKAKSRQAVKVFQRYRSHYMTSKFSGEMVRKDEMYRMVEFRDEHDAALFKMFWL